MKKIKLLWTSINNGEKSVYTANANYVVDHNKEIYTFIDARDKENVITVKVVSTNVDVYIYQTRRDCINTMYFKKRETYEGRYHYNNSFFEMKIITDDFIKSNGSLDFKYRLWLNGELSGEFEQIFEIIEKGDCGEC